MLTQSLRPFSLNDVIGQKGIVKEMKKRSKTMDFPEVMLFEGASGTGKSTLAFIISALLSDKNPIAHEDGTRDPNPESPSSKAILDMKFNRDVIYKDASNMSKDDVIDLQRTVANAPMYDGVKVVIIDESQELSKAGKGATLTLLEKKRKNVYLILCTMDIDKLDKAVKSRATCYTFKSPSTNDIAELLMNYTDENHCNVPFDEEHKQFFEEGLFLLAENCEGSVRMAVQNFERCVQGEFFKTEEIERELGIISNTKLNELLLKLVNKDTSVIKEIKEFGSKDFYYKMMKILGDSYLFASTGYLDAPWKKGLATRLSSLDLYSIINELQKAELNGYYREDLFLTYLSRAFFDPKMPQGIVRQPSAGVNPSSGRVRVPMQEGIPRREAVVIN